MRLACTAADLYLGKARPIYHTIDREGELTVTLGNPATASSVLNIREIWVNVPGK